MTLQNHVFSPFGPYSANIWPSSGQPKLKICLLFTLSN